MSEDPSGEPTRADWDDEMESVDRVRAIATTLTEPKSAGYIATNAAVSPTTARKQLRRMVEADELDERSVDGKTRYYPNPTLQYLKEISSLVKENSKEELEAEVIAIKEENERWCEQFDVNGLEELRTSLADSTVDATETRARREVVYDWEENEAYLSIIRTALSVYDAVRSAGETPSYPNYDAGPA